MLMVDPSRRTVVVTDVSFFTCVLFSFFVKMILSVGVPPVGCQNPLRSRSLYGRKVLQQK